MASSVTSPEIHYPAPVDGQHQGPKVKVTAALCLCFAGVVLATRLLIRWPWRRLFGLDDGAATAASLFAFVQWMIIIGAASQGLGTVSNLVSTQETLEVEKLMFASDMFYTLALFSSKLSVCLFFRRLSASTERSLLPDILTCVCAVLGMISIFVIGLRGKVAEPWSQNPNTLQRWAVLEAFALLIDLAIVMMTIKLVWDLRMRNSMKLWVLAGFGIRLPLIPIAIMRLKCLNTSLSSENYLFDAATTEYYTQAEMTFSLIAATIPCLRIFMQAAKTGLLGISMWEAGTTTDSYTRSHGGKERGRMSRNKGTMPTRNTTAEGIELRDRNQGVNMTNAHANSDKCSVASDGSETAIIVRQTVDVRYD